VASPSAQISFNMHYKKMFLGPDAGFGHGWFMKFWYNTLGIVHILRVAIFPYF
jgi:hypothetical protein